MAKLKIVITAEHVEDDRRHLDLETAKYCAVLRRAGFDLECKIDFEAHVDEKKEARSIQHARVRRHTLGPDSSLEPPDAGAAPAKAPAKAKPKARARAKAKAKK